ncbi:BH0856 [Halalkalibacterium halodurans C-125]|uniref:BH0856 protein n=1 Tax=Halalkalibacterium halodurans (strain ATCC BAA-125 / DSM 18197 / FERM 7344 / JCM 9153 / C-125) TaxID=272558 RepID=Q9KEJ6_HALH5|nr:BH0856 [Halalkalibacterium halodurans C-125]
MGLIVSKITRLPRARLQLIGGNRPDGISALAFPAGVS